MTAPDVAAAREKFENADISWRNRDPNRVTRHNEEWHDLMIATWATDRAAQRAAGAAAERERILAYLRDWALAVTRTIEENGGAANARSMVEAIIEDIAAQPVAPPEGPR